MYLQEYRKEAKTPNISNLMLETKVVNLKKKGQVSSSMRDSKGFNAFHP